jgi:hypothetical protein
VRLLTLPGACHTESLGDSSGAASRDSEDGTFFPYSVCGAPDESQVTICRGAPLVPSDSGKDSIEGQNGLLSIWTVASSTRQVAGTLADYSEIANCYPDIPCIAQKE